MRPREVRRDASSANAARAIKMIDAYPLLPERMLQPLPSPPLPHQPPRGQTWLSGGMNKAGAWGDYIHRVSDAPALPPYSSSIPANQDRLAHAAEVKQRVISELARQLHVRVNQKLTQRRQEVLSDYRLQHCAGTAEANFPRDAKKEASTTTTSTPLSVPSSTMDPTLAAELAHLSLPELMKRAFPLGVFPSQPSVSLSQSKSHMETVPSSIPPPVVTVDAADMPVTSSPACPMGEVVRSSATDGTERKAAGQSGSSESASVLGSASGATVQYSSAQKALEQMDGLMKREIKGRTLEDVGLVRVNRLKGVPKFNRGIFAGNLGKKRGRSGFVFGGEEGDRIPSSSQQMLTGGALFEWLNSFNPVSIGEGTLNADMKGTDAVDLGDDPDMTADNAFSFAVLREIEKNRDHAASIVARWRREQLTKAERARMNARHSRYYLSHAEDEDEDSFGAMMSSISALVLKEYGKDLSEEQREAAKKKLMLLRNKERANQKALPYIRNHFPSNPHEIKWRARQKSTDTVVFDEHRVKLPVGARYTPGVGFVDRDGNPIVMSPQEEEELLRLIKRLPHGDGDPDTFFELNQQDLDRLEELQLGPHPLTGGPHHSRPGSGHSSASIGMSKTITMEQASQLPHHRQAAVSPSPSSHSPTSSSNTGEEEEEEEAPEETPATDTTRNTSVPTRSSSSSRRNKEWQEKRALSVAEDEEKLDLFLARFPESQRHVKLRKDANAVLSSLEPLALNNSLSLFDNPLDEGVGDVKDAGENASTASFPSSVSEPPLRGFQLDEAILRERFRKEAEEENRTLTNERNRLRVEVEKQRHALQTFLHDVEYLSYGDGTKTGDEYAAALTRDVNIFAKVSNLRLNELEIVHEDGEEGVTKQRTQIGHSFLDQFGSRRAITKSVAIQVTEEDLGLVDESARLAVEQMEDLMYHERALMDSIRLATIAVANVMSFHASLELESTCKECFYLLEHPRTLWPCGHTFCQQCVSGMYNANDELLCAECGSVCDVGYTPNLSIEVVAHYQMVQESEEKHGAKRNKKLTIEGVLRRLLNDLLATQKRCRAPSTALPGVSPPLSPKAHKAHV